MNNNSYHQLLRAYSHPSPPPRGETKSDSHRNACRQFWKTPLKVSESISQGVALDPVHFHKLFLDS